MAHSLQIDEINTVHFIGIGGIGVSALARLFSHRGATVSGSDLSSTLVTDRLRDLGISVSIGHDAGQVPESADLVVHTIAIPEDNPELTVARELGMPTLTYPEALGFISKDYFTVAVSGTHGKTTTTAMLAETLLANGIEPTVVVGSFLHEAKSNFIAGDGDLLLVEACEYRRSFLHLEPDILVITNVDTDHLDYFADLADIQSAFHEAVGNIVAGGKVVANPDGAHLLPVLSGVAADVVDYSDVSLPMTLTVPGEHNRANARAAATAANLLGLSFEDTYEPLTAFAGTWRRAQMKGERPIGTLIFDDYGHHPTEIRSTLAGFRERFPDSKIIVVFQPHLYSRTKKLLGEFSESFADADEVILLPIYAAREKDPGDISAKHLAERLAQKGVSVSLAADFAQAEIVVGELEEDNGLIITQGAGDIYQLAENLTN